MPELPEVETITRALQAGGRLAPDRGESPPVAGRTILQARLLWERTLAEPSVAEFYRRVKGQRIEKVDRRGKFLRLRLSQDWLLIHLRMSGDLVVGAKDRPAGRHDRLIFTLDDGLQLAFSDARKFGRVWLLADPDTVLGSLGPEPLDPGFTSGAFHRRLAGRRRRLKPLLLEQTFLVGLGNIYVDEALHEAGLHPLTSADRLTRAQADRLLSAIRRVLQEGIRRNGASIDWVYRGGDYQHHFQVYRRTGEPCHRCGTPIERTLVAQRGTHYCPTCQPLWLGDESTGG